MVDPGSRRTVIASRKVEWYFRGMPSRDHGSHRSRVLPWGALLASVTVLQSLAAGDSKPGSPPAHAVVGALAPVAGTTGHNCVTHEIADAVRVAADANRRMLGLGPTPCVGCGDSDADAPVLPFFPMAGVIGSDIMNGQFVDLDASSPGFHDFECRPYAYDGHRGTDCGLRSFAEQFIGVPVFAARDGVVIYTNDGEPDTNLSGGFLGNVVLIDHGDGFESQYWHLKKDSVLVTVGQQVKAGQEVGRAASSGNSFGPHLHFETLKNGPSGWVVHEPFAGECRPGQSGWADQSQLDTEAPFFVDFGITRTFLQDLSPPWYEPWPLPTDAQLQSNDPWVVFWWFGYNFPEDALVRVKFTRPDGSVADDAQWNWGNTETYRFIKNWFAWDLQWLGPMAGSWRLEFWIDGQLMVDASFLVVAQVDPSFNRPPAAIDAQFEPASPIANEALFCRIVTVPLHEDPEWDVVKYRYVWTVNGVVVRDVVTAAHSDAIPAQSAASGARICCSVTPNDGTVDGIGSTITVLVSGAPGDTTGDGLVNGADIATVLGSWGACSCCAADRNDDGLVNGADIAVILGNWGG
jgi:Peptidase family M23